MAIRRGFTITAAAMAAAVIAWGIASRQEERPAPVPAAEANLFPFVRSFDGTRPDGDIEAAAQKQVASEEMVRLFDYYLSAVGEKSLDQIRPEIERELQQRLKPDAADQAKRLLARYLNYKRELVEVEKQAHMQAKAAEDPAQAIRSRFAAMQLARRNFFSDSEITAMFGMQDAYDMDAIVRLEISQDKSLTDQQKREKLAALDKGLSPALREAKEEPFRIMRLEENVQKMRAQGATGDDIYRMRAAALTPEAAARMATLDEEEKSWSARIASYLAERGALLAANGNRPETDRQAALAQLRQSRFSPEEQKRLSAYEPANTN